MENRNLSQKASIIVFSKDRPMQLHAYIESMLRFSDVQEEDITVLYYESEKIHYQKVQKAFPRVTWIVEKKFEEDLKNIVASSRDYIMFGCDDVVFLRNFNIQKAVEYLTHETEVFGFSMRLGENIVPYPSDVISNDSVMKWNWETAKEQHYDYPWELDCTLYRKADVEALIQEEEKIIKNPNYLEGIITADNRSEKISRKYMACNRAFGSAIVITVNRVQDSYQNEFDDSMMTDIYSLNRLYNDEDNSLDIEKIAKMDNHVVHVGAEYFILRKAKKGYSTKQVWKRHIKQLWEKGKRFYKKCYNYIERRLYKHGVFAKKLHIENTACTMQELGKQEFSYVRIGKDEIRLLQGHSTPAQQYDQGLVDRLKDILQQEDTGLRVGIPYFYMYPQKNLNSYMAVSALSIADQRKTLLKYCNRENTYLDSCITQTYHIYEEYDFEQHFACVKRLLSDKDVTVICGEGVLDRIQYRILDACRSVEYQYVLSTEAYAQYDTILKNALTISKDRLVCVVLGSTAKPLVYDLYQNGYWVWDIGHLLKDYDCYQRKVAVTETEIIHFYMPD